MKALIAVLIIFMLIIYCADSPTNTPKNNSVELTVGQYYCISVPEYSMLFKVISIEPDSLSEWVATCVSGTETIYIRPSFGG